MTAKEEYAQYENLSAEEILALLEERYVDDSEALEDIERAKEDIAYIRSQEDYKGQTPEQYALSLANRAFPMRSISSASFKLDRFIEYACCNGENTASVSSWSDLSAQRGRSTMICNNGNCTMHRS